VRKEVRRMFERMLLAVDGSEPAKRAAEVAADLARKVHAEVVVLHVKERDVTWAGGVDLETPQEAHDLVDATIRALKDLGVSARGEVESSVYGRAARVILETAAHSGTDLIVMGSRGLSDLAGLVMGSVAHKVLHLAQCPVLVVR
jgi:nucleotide-binding universal stress UspA family protein